MICAAVLCEADVLPIKFNDFELDLHISRAQSRQPTRYITCLLRNRQSGCSQVVLDAHSPSVVGLQSPIFRS